MNHEPRFATRLARGVVALVLLAALVVGVPWALVHFVGAPWPAKVPTFAAARLSVRQTGVSTGTLIKLVSVVVWVAWLRLAAAVVVELIAGLSNRPVRQTRLLGSSQRLASGLVAALLMMFAGMQSATAAARQAVSSPPATRVATMINVPSNAQPATPRVVFRPAASVAGRNTVASTAPVESPAAARPRSGPVLRDDDLPVTTWTVGRGDSFWRIAERHFGDGGRWREICDANLGREVAPGVVFTADTEVIHPGWTLRLPGERSEMPVEGQSVAGRPAAASVTVERGDTLTSIAAEAYGDPAEWSTVWEANRGRDFDGRRFDDPDLILPGWHLRIPDDPATLVIVTAPSSPPTTSLVDPASCLPDLPRVPIRPVGPEAGAPSTAHTPSSAAGADSDGDLDAVDTAGPRVGGSGHTTDSSVADAFTAHRSSAGAPASAVGAATGDSVAPGQVVVTTAVAEGTSTVDAGRHGSPAAPIGIGAAGLLATGAVGLIAARRRAAMRGAGAGVRLAGLTEPMIRLEKELREVAELERVARLDLAVRAAADQLGADLQLLGALVHVDGRIELVVGGVTVRPAEPFVAGESGRWVLPAEIPLERIEVRARFAAFPCPALLQMGRLSGSDRPVDVYLDLEAIGLLQVAGAPAALTADVVRAAALGLSLSPFAEQARLVTCGVPLPAMAGAIGATEVASADEAIDLAADLLSPILGALRPGQTTAHLRHASAGEAWEPALVLLAAATVDADVAAGLPALCTPAGRGLAVVTDATNVVARAQLVGGRDGWLLTPLGLHIDPIGISADSADRLAELVDAAGRVVEAPRRPLVVASPGSIGQIPAWEIPQWALMVRMLGPLDVVDRCGSPAPFERSKALELVSWLVEHRGSATRRGARAALWDGDVQDATFANVVSDARRSLARLVAPPPGDEWIGRSLSDQLAIHPLLVSDLDILRQAVAASREQPPRAALAALRLGLDLVRDMPFAASTALWPDAEGTSSQAMLTVTEAATLAAEHCLALGDMAGLFDATGRGLLAVPGHEELIALRMRAHAATGDLAGVRSEWASYERVLHADRWSSGEPAPKLAALRRELLGTPVAA